MSSFKTIPIPLSPASSRGSYAGRPAPTYQLSFAEDRVDLALTPAPKLQLARPSADRSSRRASVIGEISAAHPPQAAIRPISRRFSAVPPPPPTEPGKGRGADFWLVFVAVCSSTFLEALDFTTVSTALPTMVNDLKGSDKSSWVGAAYTLSSTAFQPLSGALADVFGRRPCMLVCLFLFAVGSAICGAAQDMSMLIAGRTVQGVGAAGIGALSDIIVADLVPLKERGAYMGILSAVWAIASAVGPSIGGVFAQKLSWRWLFYLNLPLTGFSIIMVFFFLKLKTPKGDLLPKFLRVDWLGNFIIIAGAAVVVIALTWGGVKYDWDSYQVLIPLIIGIIFTVFFLYYEKRWAKEPSVPFELLSNRTSLSGYLGTFFHGLLSTAVVYYLPLYFQSVKGHSPLKSGVDMLELSLTIAPVAVVCGVSVGVFNRYRIQNYIGWVITIVGFVLLSLIKADTHGGALAGLQLPAAIGIGILYAATTFPVLAPLGVSENAHAMAFFLFVRTFSYTFGIAIGSTVVQNELMKRLPSDFLSLFPPHQDIAYAAIDVIPTLPSSQQAAIRSIFADSIDVVWRVLAGIAGAGLLSCLIMKELPMSEEIDDQWQIDNAAKNRDADLEMNVNVNVGLQPGDKTYVVRSPRTPDVTQ